MIIDNETVDRQMRLHNNLETEGIPEEITKLLKNREVMTMYCYSIILTESEIYEDGGVQDVILTKVSKTKTTTEGRGILEFVTAMQNDDGSMKYKNISSHDLWGKMLVKLERDWGIGCGMRIIYHLETDKMQILPRIEKLTVDKQISLFIKSLKFYFKWIQTITVGNKINFYNTLRSVYGKDYVTSLEKNIIPLWVTDPTNYTPFMTYKNDILKDMELRNEIFLDKNKHSRNIPEVGKLDVSISEIGYSELKELDSKRGNSTKLGKLGLSWVCMPMVIGRRFDIKDMDDFVEYAEVVLNKKYIRKGE